MADLTQAQLDQLKAAADKEKARAPSASTPGYALPTAPAAPDGTNGTQPQPPPDQGQQIGQANAAAGGITTPAGPRSPESASTPGYGITTLPAPAAPDGTTPPSQTPQAQTPAQTQTPNEFSNPGTNIPTAYRAPVVKAEPSDDELNQKSSDDLFHDFSTSDDVNPDRAAAFWQNKKNQELSHQSFDNNKAVLWNDLSNVWNKIVQTKGVVPNTINYFKSIVNSLGGTGDDVLQAFGNQNAIDYRQDLEGKLANNTIGQQTHDQSIALVDQAQKLQDKLVNEKLSPQEQQDTKVQIAGLLTKSDPDFAQHQQSKAFQQVFTGLNLTYDKLRAVSHALDDFDNYDLNPPGFDWQKYFTGRDSAASWPAQKLADYFRAHRPVAQAISQTESGQVPGWVKGFNQWDIDWKKRMGWLPSTAEYASPEQLAKEGSPISPQRIQDTSDISNLALQLALDPLLRTEGSMELASSKLLSGSAKIAGLGPPIAGLTQKLWNSGALEPIRRGVAYYETFFQHNLPLALAWTTGTGLANLGLGAYRKYGHLASDVLDDAAKMNFEQGGPMSLLSRGARLTSDSIVHSLPYALLNSDGDSNRFWDNLTTLAPLQFAARAIPQVGQAAGTELGDNLFGRLGEFRDTTPVDYPKTDPNLNAHSQANLQDVPPDEKNQFATLQHFQNGNTQLYLVTPEVLDDYQARFGGDAQPRPYGFWVGPDRTGTGQGAAFVLKDRIQEAAAHEATHGIFFSASKEDQEALMNNALKYNDPDKFIQDHYDQKATYASLPEDPPAADPTMLNKKMIRTEMAVESLKQWFNAGNAEQYTKQNPGLLRSIRMVAGSWLERMGIPTQTFKSTSEMGINPYFANGLLSDGLWRKAAKGYQMNPKDPSWPVGNWPLNPGDTWDMTGRPPPKTPPPPTTPPTTPTTPPPTTPAPSTPPVEPAPPNAPPAQEAIARRAYEISQEREQKGTSGDHVSDWLQAENELRGGKAAPNAGPEAPAPETPASNTPEYHAQLEELIKKGVPAGEAQAIVEGRQPKTFEQEQGPPQMPGRRGAKGPIVSSPKPVWQPGAGIFGTAANALSPPTLIGAQRTNAAAPNQGPETVGRLPPPAPSAYGAPPTRAQPTAKQLYGAPPTRTQQQPTEQVQPTETTKAQGYAAPPARIQLEVKPEPSPAVTPKAAVSPSADSRTVTSTEFGYVDRAAVAAHPEKYPSKNRGFADFGSQDLSGENTKGVSVPPEDLQAHFGNNAIYRDKNGAWHASPRFAQMVKNHDVMVEVTNPANGKKGLAPIVDIGPTKSTGAGLDVLHGTAQDIGFTSGKQALSYRFAGGELPKGAPYKGYSNLADAAEANVGRLNTVQDPGTNGGELACADAVTRIVRGQMHIDLPRTLSTVTLHSELEDGASKGWYQKVPVNTPGAIVVSPAQGGIYGHTGIVGKDGKSIYSNSSRNGNWEKNYTTEGWQHRFGENVYAYLPTDKAPQVKSGEEDKWASGEGPQAGGAGGGESTAPSGPGGGGGEEVPHSPLPPMPSPEEEKSTVPGMEEAEREGAATGGGGGGYAEEPATHMTPFASMYPFGMPSAAQMRAPMTQGEAIQQSQQMAGMQPPEAPGGGGGLFYMRGPKVGGITPEEEGGAPAESTLGEPNVKGFDKLKSLLTQGGYAPDNITKAQKLHASLLSGDDTRVKKQADNMFKGEHFVAGDPMHQHMLADLPENERVALAAGQTAIANKQPMHVSYISAPPGPGKESAITRASREVNYDASSPQARLLGRTNGRLAGDSMIPTAIGIGKNRAKGMAQNSSGYLQGISTSVAAHNHGKLNEALSQMGQESPYPELGHAKFRNDLAGYVQNLLAGHKGTGKGYQAGTAEYPANPDRKYVPYRLKQREVDFLNAVINNQAARHSKGYQALAKAGGTLLNEEGEVNPIRRDIDAHMAGLRGGKAEEIKDGGIKKAADDRWSKNILEPTIRTYNAGLIHALHETPEHIPAEIRPKVPGYEKLTETLGRELTSPKGRPDVPVGVHFMPAPLSPEEHKELTGNIRKQFVSGKLRPSDYLDRIREVPEPGEPLGGVHYMPMAGKRATGFAAAKKEGRTFETPLPGGGTRFEIDDRDMDFKPPSRPAVAAGARNALEERYNADKRGPGIMPLADAIRHPTLFENYPWLRHTKISMDPTLPHYGHYAQPWLDKEGNLRGDHLVLKSPNDKETAIHEIQHAIQHYEKFAGKGTNPDYIYDRMYGDDGIWDELNKQWNAAYPERPNMTQSEYDRNQNERYDWTKRRMKEMAHAMYEMEPGEIEARVAGQRSIRSRPEELEGALEEIYGKGNAPASLMHHVRETTPKEDVLEEMGRAATRGRIAGTMSERPGISFMPAKGGEFSPTSPEDFIAARNKSKRPQFLSPLEPGEIENHQLYTNEEGTAGAAVSPEGDIQNVFNNGGGKGAGQRALAHAIRNGGRTLDAYDPYLPSLYRQFGFKETGRMKFNRDYAPPNWNFEEDDDPDIAFMAHQGYPPGGEEAAIERASGPHENWLPNERSTREETDWDQAKERSRGEVSRVAGEAPGPEAERAGEEPSDQAGRVGGRPLAPEAPGISFMRAKKAAKAPPPPPREITQETQDKLGPKPEDEKQAKLWQEAAERLDTQVKGAIPLEPDRTEDGQFKTESGGKVKYKKTNYDIANSPLLQKAGKALGQVLNKKTGKLQMAKAPDETEDDLHELDEEKRLTPYLNPTDRKRVSHLNDISAVDTFADKLHDMYKSIEHLPEVMGGKDWYDEAKTWLEHHFGGHADLVANLLAATSPGNKVKINYGMAIKAYHQFLRGAYDRHIDLYRKAYGIKQSGKGALMQHVMDKGIHTALGEDAPKTDEAAMDQYIEHHGITPRNEEGALFGHNSLHVLKVLAHTWEKEAGGPKAPNFAANLNGRSMQATIDMWAARTMRRLGYEGHTKEPWLIQPAGEPGVNDTDFGLSQLAFKKAADRIGIKPSSLQAILWFAEQKHWQAKGWERTQDAEDRDYRPMLKAYKRAPDITKAQMKRAEKVRQSVAGTA